jgi:enoyl-CoA hydratase
MAYQTLIVETHGHVGQITLNRPKALNALNAEMLGELGQAIDAFEENPRIRCMVLTGSDKAFAAGADIKEMASLTFAEAFMRDYASALDRVSRARKPIIAAVAGYCLGGGCELVMMCDIVIVAEGAKFGQPEITLGVIPGMGGTQRLPRFIGKAKAMELVLTGRMMEAAEAERAGLVTRIVPAPDLMDETMRVAEKIAHLSLPAVMMAKEAVNRAFETSLAEGCRFERRLFQAAFATEDQKEGMAAFVEKRTPQFRNR